MSDQTELDRIAAVIEAGPYTDTWESLAAYEPPRWFCDAKFGIFIHWGVYSVPAFGNEWYARNMYQQGRPEFEHHRKTYGPQDEFGYKDFIPQFTAEPTTRRSGPACSGRQAPSSWCRWPSIMTASRCTTPVAVGGRPPRWVRSGT